MCGHITLAKKQVPKEPWYADTGPGHAALALILDLRMDQMWVAGKSTFSAVCSVRGWVCESWALLPHWPSQTKKRDSTSRAIRDNRYRESWAVRVGRPRRALLHRRSLKRGPGCGEIRLWCRKLVASSVLSVVHYIVRHLDGFHFCSCHPYQPSSQHARLPEQRGHAAR